MKKYRVVCSYVGAIGIGVEAENQDEALDKAEEICNKMDDKDFLYKLEPQFDGAEVIEEIEE